MNNIKTNTNIQDSEIREWNIIVLLKTSAWDIKLKLFQDLVPNTVNNFIWLAQDWYYNNTIFHRVISNFMIQWWDPTWTWMWWESIYWEKFNDEFDSNLSNISYSISMANSWEDSNWSQFFINQNNNINLDFNKPPFSSKHSVFWQVIEWKHIIDIISKSKTDYSDKPLEEIMINEINIQIYTDSKLVDYKLDKEQAINEYKSKTSK